jgi:hypothetical protein
MKIHVHVILVSFPLKKFRDFFLKRLRMAVIFNNENLITEKHFGIFQVFWLPWPTT